MNAHRYRLFSVAFGLMAYALGVLFILKGGDAGATLSALSSSLSTLGQALPL